jgi:hypothetical protein
VAMQPASPHTSVDDPVSHAAAALPARQVLLGATCTTMTKKKCAAAKPCCNACFAVRWQAREPAELRAAEGVEYPLSGAALPQCKWPANQCGCDFDLRARGHVVAGSFVVESAEKVSRSP